MLNVDTGFKRIFTLLIIALFLPGAILASPDRNAAKKPAVKKGAKTFRVEGTVRRWKDAHKLSPPRLLKMRRMKPVLNFENPRKIVRKSKHKDPVVQTSPGRVRRTVKTMGAPMMNFDGMNLEQNGAGWPPDPTGDVGENYYMQAVNTSVGIYDKTTGAELSTVTLNAFFEGGDVEGTPCDEHNNGDPIILYDRYHQRWFFLGFAWDPSENDGSYFSIAASKTSNPAGEWWMYAFRADDTRLNDYPKCGVWHDGIYVTANMFNFGGTLDGAKIWALKTPDLYNGVLTVQTVSDTSLQAWTILPANAKSETPPPATAPNYMYAVDADEYGPGHADALFAWTYDVDWTNSNNTTWTGPAMMTVASYGLVADGVPQGGTSTTLDSLYGRLMYPAMYRNFETHESVYLCHLAEVNGVRTTRWYEVRITEGSSSIFQQGTYLPDSKHRWMASIGADKNGHIAMGYSVSSASMYPGIRYTGRLATDTPGQLPQGEETLIDGGGYQSPSMRWGDYSTITIDPVDDETFWYTQEYYSTSGAQWNTRIGSFKITGDSGGPPPEPVALNDALDNADVVFTGSGDDDWTTDISVYYFNNDSARSAAIGHGEATGFQTTTAYATEKIVSFYWKVSSEKNFDVLDFYVDGAVQSSISGDVPWMRKTYRLAAGSHTLKWVYSKDNNIHSRSDSAWVDKLEISDPTGVDSIGAALDVPARTFTLGGDQDWIVTTAESVYGGGSATVPGVLTHYESAEMETTISGVTSISFYWKVDSEADYDLLEFYIDGELKAGISGSVPWTRQTYTVSPGLHTLQWIYVKDESVTTGQDTGWVDRLVLQ